MLQAVTGEARDDDESLETAGPRPAANNRIAVEEAHIVVACPATLELDRLEGRRTLGKPRPEHLLEDARVEIPEEAARLRLAHDAREIAGALGPQRIAFLPAHGRDRLGRRRRSTEMESLSTQRLHWQRHADHGGDFVGPAVRAIDDNLGRELAPRGERHSRNLPAVMGHGHD